MSSKITPKNLHYDSTLPPFLARLRASHASRDGRHETPAARPKRARDDAEDEPVYVDEETGETVTRSEFEEREREGAKGENGEGEGEGEEEGIKESGGNNKEGREKAGGVGMKRRKARRIVGEEQEEEEGVGGGGEEAKKGEEEGRKLEKEKGRVAKKGKKIKLSFGDDE